VSWKDNAIMEWDGEKVTDHGRAPLSENTERIGNDERMHDGTQRRYHINLKRRWGVSWVDLPSTNEVVGGFSTADEGMSGEDIEQFFRNTPGAFNMTLRRGSAIGEVSPTPTDSQLPYEDENFYVAKVMITEFS
jgi:hypothetical protein